jgi:hypothetical protein
MINPGRAENRLKATEKLLATTPPNTPEYDALIARKSSQETALKVIEASYPLLLKKHLRHAASGGFKDNKGRTMNHVRTLLKGEKIEKKPGEK